MCHQETWFSPNSCREMRLSVNYHSQESYWKDFFFFFCCSQASEAIQPNFAYTVPSSVSSIGVTPQPEKWITNVPCFKQVI